MQQMQTFGRQKFAKIKFRFEVIYHRELSNLDILFYKSFLGNQLTLFQYHTVGLPLFVLIQFF